MRILHLGNIANVAWALALGQRALGHDVTVMEVGDNPFGYPNDGHVGAVHSQSHLFNLIATHDVIHFHWPSVQVDDSPVFDQRTLVRHHHGTPTRKKAWGWKRGADVEIVATPDLLAHVPDAMWVPNAVVPLYPVPRSESGPLRVYHAPSGSSDKGTLSVRRAAEAARRAGADIEYTESARQPHRFNLDAIAKSHVLVDQFITKGAAYAAESPVPSGMYGVSAVEAMYLGVSVVGHIDRSGPLAGAPIHSADDETGLEAVLSVLAERGEDTMRQRAMEYAWAEHAPVVAAERVMGAIHDAA